ncbi:hypothetical protein RJ641_024412 [Dillenia turbinata]|uniref:Uncharacterized protein n=1 Tax=Dillenia turbinata TaxID=194707 RepID=A0AAN8UGG4_9MAGN
MDMKENPKACHENPKGFLLLFFILGQRISGPFCQRDLRSTWVESSWGDANLLDFTCGYLKYENTAFV